MNAPKEPISIQSSPEKTAPQTQIGEEHNPEQNDDAETEIANEVA